jgi:hypothetical protein
MAQIAVPDTLYGTVKKRLFSKSEPETENLRGWSYGRAYGVWLAALTSPQTSILREPEFRPVPFFPAPFGNQPVSPGPSPRATKTTVDFFLTNVKGANWPVCSVQDPYGVTAPVLQ